MIFISIHTCPTFFKLYSNHIFRPNELNDITKRIYIFLLAQKNMPGAGKLLGELLFFEKEMTSPRKQISSHEETALGRL